MQLILIDNYIKTKIYPFTIKTLKAKCIYHFADVLALDGWRWRSVRN